jgi:hypothetical protein
MSAETEPGELGASLELEGESVPEYVRTFYRSELFQPRSEPRLVPESWRADRFDRADHDAGDVHYAVLVMAGVAELTGGAELERMRTLYAKPDGSNTLRVDHPVREGSGGVQPDPESWSTTRVGHSWLPGVTDDDAREVLSRLVAKQYAPGALDGGEGR